MQKSPDNRLRDIGDANLLFEDTPAPMVNKRAWLAWSVAAALLATLVPLAYLYFGEPSDVPREPVQFPVLLPGKSQTPPFAISPDGRQLAFVATGSDQVQGLWIRPLDSLESRPIARTEIKRGDFRHVPFWSPDSRYVVFDAGNELMKVDLSTGAHLLSSERLNSSVGRMRFPTRRQGH